MQGFLLIDKPRGMTSFGVVSRIRKVSGVRKVGHGGTLDPLATGLLVLALGKATKQLSVLLGADKEYEVVAHFGAISDTYDEDGKVEVVDQEIFDGKSLLKSPRREIEEIIKRNFLGEIQQMPPVFSALKVGGKRAYALARKGIKVELKPRKITVYNFDVMAFEWPLLSFRINCSSGTYIRSLVHDLGQILGCGAYVTHLRRTKIGNLNVSQAVGLDLIDSENLGKFLLASIISP